MTIQRAKRTTRGSRDRPLNKIAEVSRSLQIDKIADVLWSSTQVSFISKVQNFELNPSICGKPS